MASWDWTTKGSVGRTDILRVKEHESQGWSCTRYFLSGHLYQKGGTVLLESILKFLNGTFSFFKIQASRPKMLNS